MNQARKDDHGKLRRAHEKGDWGMRALSLFSGIGGLDLAAHAAGIETVAFCEIEPFAVGILKKRFPGVPIINDVREVVADGSLGTIDVVHGGFP